jgi:hypothetical protein
MAAEKQLSRAPGLREPAFDIYRRGALTDAGKLALSPMQCPTPLEAHHPNLARGALGTTG